MIELNIFQIFFTSVIALLLYLIFTYFSKKKNLNPRMNSQKIDNFHDIKVQCSNILRDVEDINNTKKYDRLLNTYKILYFRKIANLILDNIVKIHKELLYKTEAIFSNSNKPISKNKGFSIIISKDDINGVKMNIINLLIDFLMYVKDIASSVIHLAEKFPIQIEILYSILDKGQIKKEGDNYIVNSLELLNILFSKNNEIVKDDEVDKNKRDNSNNQSEESDILETELIYSNKDIIKKSDEKNGNSSSSDNFNSASEEKIIPNSQSIASNISFLKELDKKNIKDNIKENKKKGDKKEEAERDIYTQKIEDLMKKIYDYDKNEGYTIVDIKKELGEIDIENILKNDKELNENELRKLKYLQKFKVNIEKIIEKDNIKIIDGNFIFNKWKKSFTKNYKNDIKFKKLVIFDKNLKFNEMKHAAANLIGKVDLKIFVEDPGNFADNINNIIKQNEFDNYHKKLLEN